MSTMTTKSIRIEIELPAGVSEQTVETAKRRGEESVVLAVWQAGEISTRQADAEVLAVAFSRSADFILSADRVVRREAAQRGLTCLTAAQVVVLLKGSGLIPLTAGPGSDERRWLWHRRNRLPAGALRRGR